MDLAVRWGVQHDRLLTFVYRVFDGCLHDTAIASDLTVDLFAAHRRLIDSPDLDDERTRRLVVPLIGEALRHRVSGAAIRAAIGHAAWQDGIGRPARDVHARIDRVRAFTSLHATT
ncbi:hypothetical protein [Actinokineospora enzanensis]|uniref:hypothetical protein n=1 Tax=Actinokineospora enzanensis TaxID=155975 RepID=UPI000367BA6A|nr:hypothetical protein [Actinokineospora enzanensis]